MSLPAPSDSASSLTDADPHHRFHVGTLRYTLPGLMWVFAWLLWGDFCFTVMEYINNSIVPLRLKQLNAPDWILPIIITTVPSIINLVLNPVISVASDRHRGRLGRRIPFLLFSTPFLSGALVLMAFSPEIGGALHRWLGPLGGWSQTGMAIFTVGLLLGTFKVFDMFVNTTFWYFFADVVPQAFMARFMGLFRVVGCLAAMLYNYFFYKHALTHMRWIYLGAAAIYLFGFTMMCLMVREGEYPPPPPRKKGSHNVFIRAAEALRTYIRECLCHRFYRYFFLQGIFILLANAIGVYSLYLNLSLGITLKQLGYLNTGIQFILLLASYPAGALGDRFHPLRILLCMTCVLPLVVMLQFVWVFFSFTPDQAFHVLIGLSAIDLPVSLLCTAVGIPLMMRLLPRERFGQFCSFNSICGALVQILASFLVGTFMTGMRSLFPDEVWGKDFCYRLIPLWRIPCLCAAIVFLWLLFREWKRLGGDESFAPPEIPGDSEAHLQPVSKN